ncbi:MAG TPA: hypothetical protein VEJ87_11925, partial [Acidimicrobiales bacterium]|nr:hypothetical protein [Acidimicrobiales bacterium]
FGGGVAIKLARDNPELVRYLILLNPLGAGKRRPPWEWAIGFGIEFLPLSTALDLVQAIRSDLVPNLLQNPLGVLRAGLLAMGTDLRTEMSQLKQLGVPVLALTSERDRLIPRNAFETVCDTVGADGRVVRGGHAWLLVDPDLFGEVLASTIDVQVEEHEVARAADRKKEIYRLLKRSHLSKRDIDSLLASAAPLWLLSEAAPTLAGDLVLCRPALRKNEVRALAHRIQDSDSLRLTIVARDRPGLLADSAAVLAASGLAISNASASTWQRPNVALHSFIVDSDGDLSDEAWDALGARLRKMVSAGKAPSPPLRPLRPVRVTVEGVADQSMVKVVAPDQTGLLSAVCRHFQTHGVNIQTLRARTRDGFAHGTFVVLGEVDAVELSEYLERGATAANPSGRKLTLLPPRKESA